MIVGLSPLSQLIDACDRQAWMDLSRLSLEYSRSTGRHLAPSQTMANRALEDLRAEGHVDDMTVAALTFQERALGRHAAFWKPYCEKEWAADCRRITSDLDEQAATRQQIEAYELLWQILAVADIVRYAITQVRTSALRLSTAQEIVGAFREIKTVFSIDQQRFACWVVTQNIRAQKLDSHPDNLAVQDTIAETLFAVAADKRFSLPSAPPPTEPISAMEIVFNSRFALLGRAYYNAPINVESMLQARRSCLTGSQR